MLNRLAELACLPIVEGSGGRVSLWITAIFGSVLRPKF